MFHLLIQQLARLPDQKFNWSFGDGSFSTNTNPSHTYGPGSYDVTLIVSTPDGCYDTLVMKDIIKVSKPYVAVFFADSILCNPPYVGSFTNESGHASRVVSWDFGDGTPYARGENTTHVFPLLFPDKPEHYTITLTVV